MASVVQFDDIYLNLGSERGKLRLNESGLGWKCASQSTPFTVPTSDIRQAIWQRASRDHAVKLYLKGGDTITLDHFREDDFDAIASAVRDKLKLSLNKREMSLRGWNWGKAQVKGSELQFDVNSTPAFDVPLKHVSNTNLTGKNEVAIEFNLPDDGSAADVDQLSEMRLYVPGDGKEEDSSGEEQDDAPRETAAQLLHARLKETADVGDVAGDVIASFADVAILTPRGRYEIDLFENSMRMRGKTYDYKVQYSAIQQLFVLPKNDDLHNILVIGLDPPMRQGQTRYPYVVLQFPREEEMEVELNANDSLLAKHDKLQKTYDAPAHDVVSQVLRGLCGKKITVTSSFQTVAGHPCLKCNNKANEGALYLLERSVLFVVKPTIFIAYSEVLHVTFSRVAASASKTFDLTFKLRNGQDQQFTSINRDEQQVVEDFLKARNLKLRNDMQEEAALITAALGVDSSDDEDVPAIRGDSGDEGEESPDEDFVDGDDDSEDDLEYNSDAAMSDGDGDAEEPPKKKRKD